MRRSERADSADVAGLLGVPGPGSMVLLAIYLVTILGLAFTAGGAPMRAWSGWTALALVVLAAVLVVSRGGYPLPRAKTVVVIGATTAAAVLVPLELDGRLGAGYATWHILGTTLVLLALAVRGRIGAAWIGFALLAAATAGWTALDGAGPVPGLLMVAHEAVALFAGTLFAISLGRIIRPLAELNRREAARAAEAAAAQAAVKERAIQMQRFDGSVREAIESIASGEPLGESARASYRALEGELRDRIRGRALSAEPLTGSVRAARLRGVDVLLLDDSELPAPDDGAGEGSAAEGGGALGTLAPRIAAVVDGVADGSVTVRLTGATPRELLASVVVTSAAGPARHERFEASDLGQPAGDAGLVLGGSPGPAE